MSGLSVTLRDGRAVREFGVFGSETASGRRQRDTSNCWQIRVFTKLHQGQER